jgi:transposase
MKLHVLGIDLDKTIFHLVGLDSTGGVVIRRKYSRTQLPTFTANSQVELIGMEACSGAHFLRRALREQGHEVRLMPAQYMKPTCGRTRVTAWRLKVLFQSLSFYGN